MATGWRATAVLRPGRAPGDGRAQTSHNLALLAGKSSAAHSSDRERRDGS